MKGRMSQGAGRGIRREGKKKRKKLGREENERGRRGENRMEGKERDRGGREDEGRGPRVGKMEKTGMEGGRVDWRW